VRGQTGQTRVDGADPDHILAHVLQGQRIDGGRAIEAR
jgi:hypothetical protein